MNTKSMQSVSCSLMGFMSLVPTFSKASEFFFSGGSLASAAPLTSDDAPAKSTEKGLPGHHDASSGEYVRQYLQFVEVIS